MRIGSEELATPRRPSLVTIESDPDRLGRRVERVARFFGTGRYLVIQTIIVVVWIIFNAVAMSLRWDPYPFILLNLAFSTQAAYAAPLILLAQNRQEARDRALAERDREVNGRILSDTEFLSRELAAIRLALADVVTNADLENSLSSVEQALQDLQPDDS